VRIAFVSPLPPAASGIADYSAELLRLLGPRHELEAFHAQETVDGGRLPPALPVRRADELVARHRRRPFEAVVYQMGNGPAHAFAYDLLSRLPGLLVLHDLVLFHSRAAAFTDAEPVRAWRRSPGSDAARDAARPLLAAWREELVYSYPAQGERLFAAHLGTVGDLLPYAYPLLRIPVEASRAVLVHSAFAALAVRDEVADAEVVAVPQPVETARAEPGAVRALRARLGFGADELVVGCFGLLTREKRPDAVARAVARASAREPRLRLLLAGPVPDRTALERQLASLGLGERAVVTGRVPHEELAAHVAAADVVAHLRWPTARETSAALLRVLAQGRPTIVSDLQHQSELPETAVRRVDPAREEALEEAILELAGDPSARQGLGAEAAAYVRRAHAPERVLAGWEEALALTRRRPDPPPRAWPAHWPRAEASLA
jgi:glycosyltransferase involved in cell wall biosynthesis